MNVIPFKEEKTKIQTTELMWHCSDNDNMRQSFAGVESMAVVNQIDLPGGIRDIGMEEDQQAEVESKLTEGGIEIIPVIYPRIGPKSYEIPGNINTMFSCASQFSECKSGYLYLFEVRFLRVVVFDGVRVFATTWGLRSVGETDKPGNSKRVLDRMIECFIKAWKTVNPKQGR